MPEGYGVKKAAPAARPSTNDPTSGGGGGIGDDFPLQWRDIPGAMLENFGSSAKQYGKDIVQPIIHPIDTAEGLGKLALGALQKAIPGVQSQEVNADAFGKFLVDRYGSLENVRQTIGKDPVGFFADVSGMFTGASALGGKPFAIAGKVTDPAQAVVQGARGVGKVAGRVGASAVGQLSGIPGSTYRRAAAAGDAGGDAMKALTENMRGDVPMESVVTDARRAVGNMKTAKNTNYRQGMKSVSADTTVLDFAPVDKALRDISDIGTYKGKKLNKSTEGVWRQLVDTIDDWRNSDPKEFHTPEGMDALKQAIGDIKDSTEYGSQSRIMANKVYSAVRKQIADQAPDYARTMQGYEQASDIIKEIEKTLSLKPDANIDTSLRKLQSVMRNNVNTTYGRRVDLAQVLEQAGASNLMEKLAGQSLNTLRPRGLAGLYPTAAALASLSNPSTLAAIPLSSPRLMGEAALATGKANRNIRSVYEAMPRGTSPGLLQAGRASQDPEELLARALGGAN